MSSINVSSFYGEKSTANNNVQVMSVLDFDKSEWLVVDIESDDDISLAHLPPTNTV